MRRLTVGTSDNVRPSWSHDGQWIYFGSNRTGQWQVWKAPAEGGAAVQTTKLGGREAFESRDGKFVYYSKLDAPGIWKARVEGDQETQVLDQGWMGHWALTDEDIYLLNPRSTPPAILVFNLATRRMQQVMALSREVIPADGFGMPAIAASPDGQSILYVQADHTEDEILLVENFR